MWHVPLFPPRLEPFLPVSAARVRSPPLLLLLLRLRLFVSLFWSQEMEIAVLGLGNAGKSSFVHVINVRGRDATRQRCWACGGSEKIAEGMLPLDIARCSEAIALASELTACEDVPSPS